MEFSYGKNDLFVTIREKNHSIILISAPQKLGVFSFLFCSCGELLPSCTDSEFGGTGHVVLDKASLGGLRAPLEQAAAPGESLFQASKQILSVYNQHEGQCRVSNKCQERNTAVYFLSSVFSLPLSWPFHEL